MWCVHICLFLYVPGTLLIPTLSALEVFYAICLEHSTSYHWPTVGTLTLEWNRLNQRGPYTRSSAHSTIIESTVQLRLMWGSLYPLWLAPAMNLLSVICTITLAGFFQPIKSHKTVSVNMYTHEYTGCILYPKCESPRHFTAENKCKDSFTVSSTVLITSIFEFPALEELIVLY